MGLMLVFGIRNDVDAAFITVRRAQDVSATRERTRGSVGWGGWVRAGCRSGINNERANDWVYGPWAVGYENTNNMCCWAPEAMSWGSFQFLCILWWV